MKTPAGYLLFLTFTSCFQHSQTVQCHFADYYTNNRTTCEGDFCVNIRESGGTYKTCITGVEKPLATCQLSYSDELTCFCETDFCNNDTIFSSDFITLPIVECKVVRLRTYVAAADNKCVRMITHTKQIDSDTIIREETSGDYDHTSTDFLFNFRPIFVDKIYRNFFADACYNTTMHHMEYVIYCRCTQNNCNTPESVALPYPISKPTVTCHTGGLDHYFKREYIEENEYLEYERNMTFDTYYDEGEECSGHYCFIAKEEDENKIRYYKGCISANERGAYNIRLGYSYLSSVGFYICDTDFCNADIEIALEETRNSTKTVRDNEAGSLGFNRILTILVLISFLIGFLN